MNRSFKNETPESKAYLILEIPVYETNLRKFHDLFQN